MIGASLMLCRCHTSFKVKLAVVVTVGAPLHMPGPGCDEVLMVFLQAPFS